MSTNLEAVLKTAIDNLRAAALEREEEVKMAVILPILQALDWNPADPGAFRVEYPAGSGRVDYALLCQGRPRVFIEAKRRGKLDARAEAQLFGYAANNGVPLLVLTDGRRWDFYLSMAEGPPEERRFHRLELRDERMIADYGETLEAWLRKRQVASGEARRSAERRLESDRRRNRARDAMPEAWRALLSEPDGRLCDLLADKVRDRVGIQPERADLERFLCRLPPRPLALATPVPPSMEQPGRPVGWEVQKTPAVDAHDSREGYVEPARGGTARAERRDTLQNIVQDLMRIVLEEFPETLDQETINRLETVKKPLGLKLNFTLIRKVQDGRMISGNARYWKRPYAGKWYVCSQWWKDHHPHNARVLSAWVDSLVEGTGDDRARGRLVAIANRLSANGWSEVLSVKP